MTRFAGSILALTLCLISSVAMADDHTKATPAIDLSTPLKTYATYLDGRIADDLPAVKACVTAVAAKQAVVEVMLKYDIARHQLEKVALRLNLAPMRPRLFWTLSARSRMSSWHRKCG